MLCLLSGIEINFYKTNVHFNFEIVSSHPVTSILKCARDCTILRNCSGVGFFDGQCDLFGKIRDYSTETHSAFLKKSGKLLKNSGTVIFCSHFTFSKF